MMREVIDRLRQGKRDPDVERTTVVFSVTSGLKVKIETNAAERAFLDRLALAIAEEEVRRL